MSFIANKIISGKIAEWHFDIYYYQMTDISYVSKSGPTEKTTTVFYNIYIPIIIIKWP